MADLATCPIEGCTRRHKRTLLMCAPHWWKVSKETRTEVWDSYKEDGVLSDRYRAARADAIEEATNG